MNKVDVIEKISEILGEDISAQFEEQEEIAGISGNSQFLVNNSKGLAVQVEMDFDEENDVLTYSINVEWAK